MPGTAGILLPSWTCGRGTLSLGKLACKSIKLGKSGQKKKRTRHLCFNSSHAVSDLGRCETVPTVAAVNGFCRFRGVPKVQPAEDTQTMTHARSTFSLVVISRSKNNFYDVIRLKIIESQYFPKERSRLVWRKSNKMADNWKRRNVGEFQVRK